MLYRVDVERTLVSTFYVVGDDLETINEDASELVTELDIYDLEFDYDDVSIYPVADGITLGYGTKIWTGGPGGHFASVDEWTRDHA